MLFYSTLLTLFVASSVDATNTSSSFCSFDVPTTSFPLKLRSSAALSLPFSAPPLSFFNSSLPVSPVLPVMPKYKQFVKKPFDNASKPISDPIYTPVGMDISMLAVVGWALLNILVNFVAFSLIADAAPHIEAILAEIVSDLEEEQYVDAVETQEKPRFLLEIVDFDFEEEGVEGDEEDDVEWVEEDFVGLPCPPPSPVSDDEESHC